MERGKSIGVVDNDPGTLKALKRLLIRKGFKVETFDSAEAFLANDYSTVIACLVLDIQLGEISGIELQRRLVATDRDIPVIFITALDDERTYAEAMETGCIAFLRKPFLSKQLIDAVEKAGTFK